MLYYKNTNDYSIESSYCFLNPMDMMELGVENKTNTSSSKAPLEKPVFKILESPKTSEGVVFIPCGPYANFILHELTHSTGTPYFKGITVDITTTDSP